MNSHGVINLSSNHSVIETANVLEATLSEKGMVIFARIDHSAGAKKIEQTLRPTELIIFGNPQTGTPLMQSNQLAALDLPQKMLVWENDQGQTIISYNDPSYLAERHAITDCDALVEKISGALHNFSQAAAQ